MLLETGVVGVCSGRSYQLLHRAIVAVTLVALVACGSPLASVAVPAEPAGAIALQPLLPTPEPSSSPEPVASGVPVAPSPVLNSNTILEPVSAVLGALPTSAAQPSATPTPSPSPTSQDAEALRVQIQALLDDYSADGVGIAGVVIEADGAAAVVLNGDRAFATASLYKLFVLWGVQRTIAAGDLTVDTLLTFLPEDDDSVEDGYLPWAYGDQISVADLREVMITTSNNSATWILARTVGWWEIDQSLQANGFRESRTAAGVSTPREIARFFDGLLNRTLDPRLRPGDYDTMLALLLAQKVNAYLSPGFPPNAVFAHKTGNLPGVINDAGILYLPDGRIVTVVVMTEGDEAASFELLRAIAAAVWAYYAAP